MSLIPDLIKRSASSSSTSTVTSAQHSHAHFHPHGGRGQQRSHTSSPTTTQTSQDNLRNSPKVCFVLRLPIQYYLVYYALYVFTCNFR